LDQRLLQEEAIRRSGVSGPLGMGVVMQSVSSSAAVAHITQQPLIQNDQALHSAHVSSPTHSSAMGRAEKSHTAYATMMLIIWTVLQ